MANENATKLIKENKIQAQRDLDSANVLLSSHDPHLENVAFLLEQSFEKIVKASYAKHKLETDSASGDNVYKEMLGHDIDFILKALDGIYKNRVKTATPISKSDHDRFKPHDEFSEEKERLIRYTENLTETINMQKLEEQVKYTKINFVAILSSLNSESMKESESEFSGILQMLGTAEKSLSSIDDVTNFMPILQMLHEHLIFLMHLIIAPYVLPHAIYSRYPSEEHDMRNLEAYRNNPNLKGFFSALAGRIQDMLDTEAGFTKLLIEASLMD